MYPPWGMEEPPSGGRGRPCSRRGHGPCRMHPPFLFCRAKRETGRARSKEKSVGALRCSSPPRDGGRRIGASADLALPSGTLWPSARSVLPSRGGWCPDRRGAKPHLTSFSFTVSRCGAPSISVTSVPLAPPSARSACPQGARRIRKRQSRQRLRSRYALPRRA